MSAAAASFQNRMSWGATAPVPRSATAVRALSSGVVVRSLVRLMLVPGFSHNILATLEGQPIPGSCSFPDCAGPSLRNPSVSPSRHPPIPLALPPSSLAARSLAPDRSLHWKAWTTACGVTAAGLPARTSTPSPTNSRVTRHRHRLASGSLSWLRLRSPRPQIRPTFSRHQHHPPPLCLRRPWFHR